MIKNDFHDNYLNNIQIFQKIIILIKINILMIMKKKR